MKRVKYVDEYQQMQHVASEKKGMNDPGTKDGHTVGDQPPSPMPHRGKVSSDGGVRKASKEVEYGGKNDEKLVDRSHQLNVDALSPANIDITLRMTFSTL